MGWEGNGAKAWGEKADGGYGSRNRISRSVGGGNAIAVVESIIEGLRGVEGPRDLLELPGVAHGCFSGERFMTVAQADNSRADDRFGKLWERKVRELEESQGGMTCGYGRTIRAAAFDERNTTLMFWAARWGFVRRSSWRRGVGPACVIWRGGAGRKEDSVDPAVGDRVHKKIGRSELMSENSVHDHCHSEAQAARRRKLRGRRS